MKKETSICSQERFEVLTVPTIKIGDFRDVTQCILVEYCQHFKETYCLHLQNNNSTHTLHR
jgi:hypothetical protein